jgi:hypothetical protein
MVFPIIFLFWLLPRAPNQCSPIGAANHYNADVLTSQISSRRAKRKSSRFSDDLLFCGGLI